MRPLHRVAASLRASRLSTRAGPVARPVARHAAAAPTPLQTAPSPAPQQQQQQQKQQQQKQQQQQLQPLVDAFARRHTYLRLSLTERCNLRCRYCMPDEGVPLTPAPHLLSTPELARVSALFVSRGIDKVRLTGGEPLLRNDIVDVLQALQDLEDSPRVSITTNGILLRRYLPDLVDAGLSGVNISLDTLVEAKFELISRRKGHSRVLQAIRDAAAAGLRSVKVNVVMMKGVNDDEIDDFARLTEHLNVDVRFIEYMPFDGNRWSAAKFVSYAEMLETIARTFGRLERLTDSPNDTTKHYRVPGFRGRIGFITSMSEHFCGTCNRIRITADGNVKACLFGQEEVSLRDAMRAGATDAELSAIVDQALMKKHWKLGGNEDMHDIATKPNRSMIRIGG